jgi:O-antigen/teichoic acid export membrane protein
MNKYKTLVSNTALISLGTFGSKLLVFFMVRFYTGYLTTEQYGIADLITQTANLLLPIISVGITDGVFRFAIDSKIDRKSVFSSGVYTITLGGLAFALIVPILWITHQFDGYIWLIVLYTMFSCYHSLCSKYIRACGSTAFFAIQGIVNTSLVIVLNILFLAVFNFGVTGYVLSVAIADLLSTLLIVVRDKLWRDVTFKVDKTVLKEMLRYSIPMIPATIFWWVTSVSNRYFVNGFFGADANGIYAVAYKIPTLLTLISTVFMQAWQFSAVLESENDRKAHIDFFSKVWGSFQSVMFLVAGVVTALSVPLIKILTTESFYGASKYIPMLTAAMVYSAFANFMGSVYVVEKRSKNSFLTTMVGAIATLVLTLLLIKTPLGVQGAAIATFVSYLLVFVIRAINASKYIPFKLYWSTVILNTLIIIVQTVFMVKGLPYNTLVQAVCVIALAVANFKFVKVFIMKMLSLVRRR